MKQVRMLGVYRKVPILVNDYFGDKVIDMTSYETVKLVSL